MSRQKRTQLRPSQTGDQIQLSHPDVPQTSPVPRIAFGLVPLTTPYGDSEPDHRVLNAVARGLLFERIKEPAEELEMTRLEYSRSLRSLKNDGLIYVGSDGKYRLTFGTANFPNLIARDDGI